MSMTQMTTQRDSPDSQHCPKCDALLPPHAAFCSTCGERISKPGPSNPARDLIGTPPRYRITSLVRRRPSISLYFALDTQLQPQSMVAISEIDISCLDDQARKRASEIVQREYDLLRQQQIPHIMPILETSQREGLLYVVAGRPGSSSNTNGANGKTEQVTSAAKNALRGEPPLHTLQALLQSGIGLPDEQVAIQWVENLCEAVDRLHSHQIVIGDLDPETIVLASERYDQHPALMLSWLPLYVRTQLPLASGTSRSLKAGPFSAPEVQLGKIEPRSDVYSLGALLYLLLTGLPPSVSGQRSQRLRSPRELNPRVKPEIDSVVMRALATERSERFQSAASMAETIAHPFMSTQVVRFSRPQPTEPSPTSSPKQPTQPTTSIDMIDTIPVTPPNQETVERWRAARRPPESMQSSIPSTPARIVEAAPTPAAPERSNALAPATPQVDEDDIANYRTRGLQKRITGMLPAIQGVFKPPTKELRSAENQSLFKQVQRFILGEQQHSTSAAALIETPLRVQPGQDFSIRVHLLGRDRPALPPGIRAKKGEISSGLSALGRGDYLNIEVRSAFYQRYAFVIQRAAIKMPGQGYATDVTIPMPPPNQGHGGRRERLHIFFTDEFRRPLYEKPFVVEIFISPLVRSGQEGHQSLPIPF